MNLNFVKILSCSLLATTLFFSLLADSSEAQDPALFSFIELWGDLDSGYPPEVIFFGKLTGANARICAEFEELNFDVDSARKMTICGNAIEDGVKIDEHGVNTKGSFVVNDLSGDPAAILSQNSLRFGDDEYLTDPSAPFTGLICDGDALDFYFDDLFNPIPTARFDSLSFDFGSEFLPNKTGQVLRVFDNLGTSAAIMVRSNLGGFPEMLTLSNPGGVKFSLKNPAAAWSFNNDTAGRFTISTAGTGGPEFSIDRNGRFIVGPGPLQNFVVASNGDAFVAGTLHQSSDKNKKTDFEMVNAVEILEQVVKLPVTSWRYKKSEPNERHIGPMAQDFRAAFALGHSEKTIATVDGIGVSLAAIKGLNQKVSDMQKQMLEKDERILDLKDKLQQVMARLDSLESK